MEKTSYEKLLGYLLDGNVIRFRTPMNFRYAYNSYGNHEERFAETKRVYYHYDRSESIYDESGVYLVCTDKVKFRPDWRYHYNENLAYMINLFAGIEYDERFEGVVLLDNDSRKYLYDDEFTENDMYAYFPDTKEVPRLGIELSDIWDIGDEFELRIKGLNVVGEADGREFILREILNNRNIKDGISKENFLRVTRSTLPLYWDY